MEIKRIIINKNRGWRGLAEVRCYNSEHKNIKTVIFSFSERVWTDLMVGKFVISDDTNYYILHFDNISTLPKGQRSVLIKNFNADVVDIKAYNKHTWNDFSNDYADRVLIEDHIKNRNNHTTSDWNCIGVRVVPVI